MGGIRKYIKYAFGGSLGAQEWGEGCGEAQGHAGRLSPALLLPLSSLAAPPELPATKQPSSDSAPPS